MKVTKEQNAAHHRAIIETASRLFRERGFDDVSVIDIMKGAGLTHGAFYGHFSSKAELAAEVCRQTFEKSLAEWTDDTSLSRSLDLYLSVAHRDKAGSGCPMASFVSKVGNQDKIVKQQFSSGVSNYVEKVARQLIAGGLKKPQARKQAVAIVSTMIGGMALARSISATDRQLSSELLAGSRAAIRSQFGV